MGIHAFPYAVLQSKNPEELGNYIRRLIVEEGIGEIVVGMPLTSRGTEGSQAKWVHDFASKLKEIGGVSVVFWDERLTTREAERRLRETGTKPRQLRGKSDSAAAALILQSYLDRRRKEGERSKEREDEG
jgi:putative Holliday junction resolvase